MEYHFPYTHNFLKAVISMDAVNPVVLGYLSGFRHQIDAAYAINDSDNVLIKHGLRNADGTGVLIGTTGIGSVQGYVMEDGERVPMPGKLTYRGIDATEIAEAHFEAGTFGYEEVEYLVLLGKLPFPSLPLGENMRV